jgi:uncharacterized membrane protein YhaH (DUF805 family)
MASGSRIPRGPESGNGFWLGLMLAALVMSLALFLWHPFWFTPPLTGFTPFVYLLAWVPVWAVGWRRGRLGDRARRSLLLIAVLVVPFWCVLASPIAGAGVFATETPVCQELPASDGQVLYICESSEFTLVLKGPKGWPVARLEEFTLYGSDNPRPRSTPGPDNQSRSPVLMNGE